MNIRTGITGLTATIRQDRKSPRSENPAEAGPPSTGHRVFDGVLDTGFFLFNELVETGKNDPALALRYGATSLSEQLLTGVGENVRTTFNAAIIPTIRFCILGANGYRLNKTLKDPNTHIAEKAFDIARMATDVMGLAGSVMKYAWPAKAALGDTLVGISYAADSVSHSVRLMTHGAERVTVWKKALAERKEANRREREVNIPRAWTAPAQ
jgi:hypothetical protein